ncbi:MAG: hypothetical protein DIU70_004880 [Bacillota bacterium]
MPMLEVVLARETPLSREQKRAFALAAEAICREVLGTPPGRLRVIFWQVPPEETIEGLRAEGLRAADERPPPADRSPGRTAAPASPPPPGGDPACRR